MAELVTIARPYAQAIFQLATDSTVSDISGTLHFWENVLKNASCLMAHPDVLALVQHPQVSISDVVETFVALLGEKSAQVKEAVHVLAARHRLLLLPHILKQFLLFKNAYKGVAEATISTPYPLADDDARVLCDQLQKKFGRQLRPNLVVDKSLLGGVRVVVEDQVLDTTIKAQLQNMQAVLMA